MKLTVVGCSGSFPGPDSAASCYLVEHEGYRVLLDLGNGALGPLQTHVGLDEIDAILISHLHSDHYIDLCSYYVVRNYHPTAEFERLPVVGPSMLREQVTRAYGAVPSAFDRVFAFGTVEAVAEFGPFRVASSRVSHPVEAYAFRLEADGRVLTYSGDTAPCGSFLGLAEGADVLLAEASFVDGADNPPDLHLTGKQAGEAAEKAGVGRLLVTHVPPWYSRATAADAAAGVFSGPAEPALPGMAIAL